MQKLFENFRNFINEGVMDDKPYLSDKKAKARFNSNNIYTEEEAEQPKSDEIESAVLDTLEKEGGAAGFKPLFDAAKKIDPDITEEQVKEILSALSNVKQHKDEDYIEVSGLELEEAVNIFLEAKEDLLDEKRKRKKKKKKKKKRDACYSKVKARYKVWPSAYASGALVKCRKVGAANWGTGGKKKKKRKNESLSLEDMIREEIQNVLDEACWETHKQVGMKKKDGRMVPNCVPKEGLSKQELELEEDLKKWFSQNKGKGWVDCKTGKPCGRQKGEKRKGYPACRPTMAQCTEKGKRAKKSSKEVEWE